MLEFTDALGSLLRKPFSILRSREQRKRISEDVRLVLPLALRQLRRNRGRSVLLALVVSLAVGLYLVASAAMSASIERMGAQSAEVWMPADVLIYGPTTMDGDWLRPDLAGRLGIAHSEAVVVKDVYSERGATLVVGTTFPAQLFSQLGLPGDLRDQLRAGEHVGLFPESAGYHTGEEVWLGWLGDQGWQEARIQVVGLYADQSGPFATPLIAREVFTTKGEALNGWLGLDRNPHVIQRTIARRLRGGDQLITSISGQSLLSRMSSQAMGPVRVLMSMGILLAALGMFNLLLLAFLRRKRQLGTLKALGMESGQLGLLLTCEGAIVATAGLLLGYVVGTLTLRTASWGSGVYLQLSVGTYLGAALVAAVVFALASWVPVRLCRLATVDQLLHARRVYVNPNPSCVNCGRCGGF